MQPVTKTTTTDQLITADNALTLDQIAEIASLRDHKVSYHAVRRWCKEGLRGVRLQYVRLGRRMLSSKPALNQFMKELQDQDDYEWPEFERKEPPPPKVKAGKQHEEAKRVLEQFGV